MAAFNELTAAARRFYDKVGGHKEFKVDAFDTFIIDEHLAPDPETSDTKDPRFKGFVQQRGVLKNKLDRAARHIPNGEAYSIKVIDSGETWALVPLDAKLDSDYQQFGKIAAKHVENSLGRLQALERNMRDKLRDEYDPRLQQVIRINGMMMAEAIGFTSQVKGLASRYDTAYEQAHAAVEKLAAAVDALALEDQTEQQ